MLKKPRSRTKLSFPLFRCYLLKETPNEEPKGRLPQLTKLARSSSFNQGLANWQNAKMKWDRDRGTSPAKSLSSAAPGTSGPSGSGSSGTSSGASFQNPDTSGTNDPDLEKELNWDEILKSPFNFVEGSKVLNLLPGFVIVMAQILSKMKYVNSFLTNLRAIDQFYSITLKKHKIHILCLLTLKSLPGWFPPLV